MSIEFRCGQCNKLLRTGDDTAGRRAKCPECGAMTTVPGASDSETVAAESVGPSSGGSESPFASTGGENPYESPGQRSSPYGSMPAGSVPNYLVQAILVTFFCCIPFGIVAIVFAAQVNGKLASGDYQGAVEASNQARTWCIVAFALGLISCLPAMLLLCAGGIG